VQGGAIPAARPPDVYVIAVGERSQRTAMALAERLRDDLPHLALQLNMGAGNFKAQFRRADRSGAPLGLILGDAELERGVAALKPLRQDVGQSECALPELAARIPAMLAELAALNTTG